MTEPKLPWLIVNVDGVVVGRALTKELATYFREALDGDYTVEQGE